MPGHAGPRVPITAGPKVGESVTNRRHFLKGMLEASAATFLLRRGLMAGPPQALQGNAAGAKHKPVLVAGKKVKTVDVHCHVSIPEAADLLKGTPLERRLNTGGPGGPGPSVPTSLRPF